MSPIRSNSTVVSSLTPSNWPVIPFHVGEQAVQKRLGVHESVMTYGPRVIRPFMPDQHREFYSNQPFLVVAARDSRDKMWSTLLFGSSLKDANSFIDSHSPKHLELDSQPLHGDALEGALLAGSDLGILGIEFATRRRNRVNGRIEANDGEKMIFKVDQSFGNCPQYIKPREWWTVQPKSSPATTPPTTTTTNDHKKEAAQPSRADRLTVDQLQIIRKAETIFVATGYRGEGEDPRFGNDASHRGGTKGFLKVSEDGKKIFLPDYAGNNMYMSLGNLVEDSRMGVTVPLYETGGLIQMTGTAMIHWEDSQHQGRSDDLSLADFPGALRWLEFDIDEIVELPPGSLPIRWDGGKKGVQLQVIDKIVETDDVTSFHLAPLRGENLSWTNLPGQHLTVALPVPAGRGSPADSSLTISRSYSISNYHQVSDENDKLYRISIRRDPFGVGSAFLHDQVEVGDLIHVQQPSGDFIYRPKRQITDPRLSVDPSDRTVLFLSAGIGVTPILSMLHAFIGYDSTDRHRQAIWLHSARNGRHHAFKKEVEELTSEAVESKLRTFVSYTRPSPEDDREAFDFEGRIDAATLSSVMSQAGVVDATTLDVFMCGPNSFVGSMQEAFGTLGVKSINYETF
jgi:uncharacterized protein